MDSAEKHLKASDAACSWQELARSATIGVAISFLIAFHASILSIYIYHSESIGEKRQAWRFIWLWVAGTVTLDVSLIRFLRRFVGSRAENSMDESRQQQQQREMFLFGCIVGGTSTSFVQLLYVFESDLRVPLAVVLFVFGLVTCYLVYPIIFRRSFQDGAVGDENETADPSLPAALLV